MSEKEIRIVAKIVTPLVTIVLMPTLFLLILHGLDDGFLGSSFESRLTSWPIVLPTVITTSLAGLYYFVSKRNLLKTVFLSSVITTILTLIVGFITLAILFAGAEWN